MSDRVSVRMAPGFHPDSVGAQDPEWFSERHRALVDADTRGDWDEVIRISSEIDAHAREIRKAILARMVS